MAAVLFVVMAAERTFIAIKPDGVQRGLVGEIVGRFERKGFKLVGLKQLTPSRELAEQHYGVHKERPFFAGLVDFITSGPVVAMVWEGDGVIASARKLIGATKPLEAEPGTIRGDLAVNIGRNVIHGSDAPETAQFEIGLWFQPSELSEWTPSDQGWRVEEDDLDTLGAQKKTALQQQGGFSLDVLMHASDHICRCCGDDQSGPTLGPAMDGLADT